MAILDRKNTKIARTGVLWEADLDTPWPTSNTEIITAPWRSWGYLGTDGLGEELSRSEEELKAWQDNETIDTIVTDSGLTYSVPVLETRKHVIETIYGTTVNPDGSYHVDPGAVRPRRKFVFESVDKRTMKKTMTKFIGTVTDLGSINYTSTEFLIITPTIKTFGGKDVIDDLLADEVETVEN